MKLSGDEVRAVLRRTADLQQTETDRDVDPGALSLAEIEDVAEEMGMNRALVRRAAIEVAGKRGIRRGPKAASLERTIAGPMNEDILDDLAQAMRKSAGGPGRIERDGGSWIWRSDHEQTALVVVRQEHETTLRLEEQRDRTSAAVSAGVFFGLPAGLVVALVLSGLGPSMLVFPVFAVLGFALAYSIGRQRSAQREQARNQHMRELFEGLVLLAEPPPG